jgi:hypothetical protein
MMISSMEFAAIYILLTSVSTPCVAKRWKIMFHIPNVIACGTSICELGGKIAIS